MSITGSIIGILSLIGMTIAFIPLLGWLNWLNIPFAIVGVILSIVGAVEGRDRGVGIIGIILCRIAIVLGSIRLFLGGGIF